MTAASPPLPDACETRCVHPQTVQAARARQPDDAAVTRASDLLKGVADPTRLRLLSALGSAELCVCDLAAVVNLSESAVSHQLRVLRGLRLVESRKEGRVVYYRLLDQHVRNLIQGTLEHVGETE